jgi:hypothetical protein
MMSRSRYGSNVLHFTRNTPQAFSHFTWVASRKQLIVCDIQGVGYDKHDLYTDPQVHTADQVGNTGTGAGGDHGIDHHKNPLRFPYLSEFSRSHDLSPPAPVSQERSSAWLSSAELVVAVEARRASGRATAAARASTSSWAATAATRSAVTSGCPPCARRRCAWRSRCRLGCRRAVSRQHTTLANTQPSRSTDKRSTLARSAGRPAGWLTRPGCTVRVRVEIMGLIIIRTH